MWKSYACESVCLSNLSWHPCSLSCPSSKRKLLEALSLTRRHHSSNRCLFRACVYRSAETLSMVYDVRRHCEG